MATLPDMTPAERAVLRIREEMAERRITQRDLSDKLRCSQGRVAKLMNGGLHLRFNDVATLAEAVGITMVEAVRDRGLEFFAELTPDEVRLLEGLRQRPEVRDGVMQILGLRRLPITKRESTARKRKGPGRPLDSQRRANGT